MYAMPNREGLLKKVNGFLGQTFLGNVKCDRMISSFVIYGVQVCGENVQRNIDILPKMLEVTADVYNRTDSIYETYQLHALP